MKLTLLKGINEPLTYDENNAHVRIVLGRLAPEHISEMAAFLYKKEDAASAISIYAMRHCMTELEIDGEKYDNPAQLSFQISPVSATAKILFSAIGSLLIEHVIIDDETRKKLESQPPTSSQEKTGKAATAAPTASEA